MDINKEFIKRMEELEIENKELRKRCNIGPTDIVTIGHSEENPKFACAGCNALQPQALLKKGKCPHCRAEDELKDYEDANKVLKKYG